MLALRQTTPLTLNEATDRQTGMARPRKGNQESVTPTESSFMNGHGGDEWNCCWLFTGVKINDVWGQNYLKEENQRKEISRVVTLKQKGQENKFDSSKRNNCRIKTEMSKMPCTGNLSHPATLCQNGIVYLALKKRGKNNAIIVRTQQMSRTSTKL